MSKQFLNSIYIKEGKFQDQLSFSGKLDAIITDLKKIVNEKGYVNLFIQKRKQPTKNTTHYIYHYQKEEIKK